MARERVETVTTCSACGGDDVPFKPTQGRPVFCKECFQSRNSPGPEALARRPRLVDPSIDQSACAGGSKRFAQRCVSSRTHSSGAFHMQIEERPLEMIVLDLKGKITWAKATNCSRTRSTVCEPGQKKSS
jgi:CxxC-x17-CxxC domain-containing protein